MSTHEFSHEPWIWSSFPALVAGVAALDGVRALPPCPDVVDRHVTLAHQRLLAGEGEGSWPEVQAWRRVFGQMGLKPTQVRCAVEALLRRLRKEGTLPSLHPLVDLCNALSVRHAVPVAVFDLDQVTGPLIVRRAEGVERYETFAGEVETPESGEVVFADAAQHAHARRWAHRQSARSAVREATERVLIVAEAHHPQARATIDSLLADLRETLAGRGPVLRHAGVLTASKPVAAWS
jgi:DNA/RNA-binding domain of Phe-tRNA-synthetase-like protein